MEREILFKAKNKHGEWIYGIPTFDMKYLFDAGNYNSPDSYEIDPKTLCQFTGFFDKKGTKIFESDMIQDEDKNKFIVKWQDGAWFIESLVKLKNEPVFSHWLYFDGIDPKEWAENIGNLIE